jgi:hypothetical protein
MKKIIITLLLLSGLMPAKGFAQTEEEKAWMAYMTPGEPHKMLEEETGTWDCEMTLWMAPGAKPEKYKSVAEVKMVMGGRYQEAVYKGEMMGMPFEGKSTVGYNNASKQYITTFMDNMGTGIMVSYGTYDKTTKTLKSKGETVSPIDGKKTPYREEYTFTDNNTRKLQMFDMYNGKEYKSMELIMKRRK